MPEIFDYKIGDKVFTPTGRVATVIKETYKGERLILKYDESNQLTSKGKVCNHPESRKVTLQKEHVRPVKRELYTTCKVVVR